MRTNINNICTNGVKREWASMPQIIKLGFKFKATHSHSQTMLTNFAIFDFPKAWNHSYWVLVCTRCVYCKKHVRWVCEHETRQQKQQPLRNAKNSNVCQRYPAMYGLAVNNVHVLYSFTSLGLWVPGKPTNVDTHPKTVRLRVSCRCWLLDIALHRCLVRWLIGCRVRGCESAFADHVCVVSGLSLVVVQGACIILISSLKVPMSLSWESTWESSVTTDRCSHLCLAMRCSICSWLQGCSMWDFDLGRFC